MTFEELLNNKINKNIDIPSKCPLCKRNLAHVNSMNQEPKLYMVYCSYWGCRWGQYWKYIKGEWINGN